MQSNFGSVSKIWTGTKHFGTCKRTRHKLRNSDQWAFLNHFNVLFKFEPSTSRFLKFSQISPACLIWPFLIIGYCVYLQYKISIWNKQIENILIVGCCDLSSCMNSSEIQSKSRGKVKRASSYVYNNNQPCSDHLSNFQSFQGFIHSHSKFSIFY